MINSENSLGVLDLLYGTLDDPDKWGEWLDETCRVLRADGGNIAYIPVADPSATLFFQNYCSPRQMEIYTEKFMEMDWQRNLLEDLPTGFINGTSRYSFEQMRPYFDSQYFQEFAVDTPMYSSMGGYFHRDSTSMGTTGFHRRSLDDPFLADEMKFIERLHPHINRVIGQHDFISLLEDAVSVMGQHGDGVLLLDGTARVQYANQTAADLVGRGGLSIKDQTLSAHAPNDTVRLRAAIASILRASDARLEPGTDHFVSRPDNPIPLIVSVTPNHRARPFYQANASTIRVVVTIKDPGRHPELKRRVLEHLYGFTPRELEIGSLLATGRGLRSISEQVGISYETARTHTKRMIQKAGISGQAQLMAFLTALSD